MAENPARPRLTFLLPSGGRLPSGGFKIVYEYANGLARRGWRVRVVHPHDTDDEGSRSLAFGIRRWAGYYRQKLTASYRPDAWFKVEPAVKLIHTRTLSLEQMPPSDVWVIAAWQSAEWAARYPEGKGIKLWLVQDYEHYMTGPEDRRRRMRRAFCDPGFFRVGYACVVRQMLEGCGARMDARVSLGVDHGIYRLSLPVDSRERAAIGFSLRREPAKGLDTALKALQILHGERPEAKVWAFGNAPARELPGFLKFHPSPSDRQLSALYNQSAVFAVASDYEGWGLPGSEAMACGAALASTDTGGVREYAEGGSTALLSPPRDPEALAANILRLMEDRELRLKLAREGNRGVQQFTWERAVSSLEAVLEEVLRHRRFSARSGVEAEN